MSTFVRFLYEFMSVFFNGLFTIGKGIVSGFAQMFNVSEYLYIIQFYKNDFKVAEWILVVVAIIVLLLLLGLILALGWLIIRKYIRFRKTLVEQESMLYVLFFNHGHGVGRMLHYINSVIGFAFGF